MKVKLKVKIVAAAIVSLAAIGMFQSALRAQETAKPPVRCGMAFTRKSKPGEAKLSTARNARRATGTIQAAKRRRRSLARLFSRIGTV